VTCTRTTVFLTSSNVSGMGTERKSESYLISPHTHALILIRSCLTGSYHNYFRIYDTDTLQDVVLQADKSAFKSKKLGGPNNLGKGPKGNGIKKESMNIDTIDFNKKILHASWHPHENTIAVSTCSFFRRLLTLGIQIAATNNLFLVSISIPSVQWARPHIVQSTLRFSSAVGHRVLIYYALLSIHSCQVALYHSESCQRNADQV
jgi:hypothetical protein